MRMLYGIYACRNVVHGNGFVCQNPPVHSCDLGGYPTVSIRSRVDGPFDIGVLEMTDQKNKVQNKKHYETKHAMRAIEDNKR
jgi:hypothetical protein